MQGELDVVTKLPKLTGAEDFTNWRRRVGEYIEQQDIELIGLKTKPIVGTSDKHHTWAQSHDKGQ